MPRFLLVLFLAVLVWSLSAHAQEVSDPTWRNLAQGMVRFNAFDLNDATLIDEYTIITECDLYRSFYHDDFKWNEVRKAVRQSIAMNIATYPTRFHYETQLQLDRYDFSSKVFRFREKSVIQNVNAFVLKTVDGTGCGVADVKNLPRIFRAVIMTPIYMDGLPLAEDDARAVMKLMDTDSNTDRIIYASFNLRITYIEPLRKSTSKLGGELVTRWMQSNALDARAVRLDAQLDSIEFYEDPDKKRLIYRYQP